MSHILVQRAEPDAALCSVESRQCDSKSLVRTFTLAFGMIGVSSADQKAMRFTGHSPRHLQLLTQPAKCKPRCARAFARLRGGLSLRWEGEGRAGPSARAGTPRLEENGAMTYAHINAQTLQTGHTHHALPNHTSPTVAAAGALRPAPLEERIQAPPAPPALAALRPPPRPSPPRPPLPCTDPPSDPLSAGSSAARRGLGMRPWHRAALAFPMGRPPA